MGISAITTLDKSFAQAAPGWGYALGFVSRQLQNDREATNSWRWVSAPTVQTWTYSARECKTYLEWNSRPWFFDLSICQLFHCLWLSSHWTRRIVLVVACSGRTGCSATKWAGTWKGALEIFFRGHVVGRFLVILPWLKDGCPKSQQASDALRNDKEVC